eukprot:754576-Hanusia_phi.AAC.2
MIRTRRCDAFVRRPAVRYMVMLSGLHTPDLSPCDHCLRTLIVLPDVAYEVVKSQVPAAAT